MVQGCQVRIQSFERKDKGVQQERCSILWKHFCQDEQVRASKLTVTLMKAKPMLFGLFRNIDGVVLDLIRHHFWRVRAS